jgi:imidazoleglycerol-phosphate dehydratase
MTETPFTLSNVQAVNLGKSSYPINTGIGFFDHMLDQLNSHAQVGISVTVNEPSEDRNRHADDKIQDQLMSQVGTAIGLELAKLIPAQKNGSSSRSSSRFVCPLDEALVECILVPNGKGQLIFSLAPYGEFPKGIGRTKIGHMMTKPLESFFNNLANASGLSITLTKIRGQNGHHVVESAFKAFSRALRNLIDGTCVDMDWEGKMAEIWGIESKSNEEGLRLERKGVSTRSTKETSIDVEVYLDCGSKGVSIHTGINILDEFYTRLAEQSQISLMVNCKGDTWVDDHHTAEDVSIAVGKVLNSALGTKAGLNRMWCSSSNTGDAVVEVTMDLSNRPCLTQNLSLHDEEYVGDLSTEMFDHVLDSLVMNGQMTVHVLQQKKGTVEDLVMATAEAFGRALRLCAAVDPRRAGKTASSKGTLSA